MTDSDTELEGLSNEMNFETPAKIASEQNDGLQGHRNDTDIITSNRARLTDNKVLFSEASLTNTSNLDGKFEKVSLKSENILTKLLDDDEDNDDPGTLQSTKSNSKKYRLFYALI